MMAETTDAIDPAWQILFNTTPLVREAYHAAIDAGCSEVVAMRQVALTLAALNDAAPKRLAAGEAVLGCDVRHDDNGYAYIHLHARRIFDLPAQIRASIEQAEGKR